MSQIGARWAGFSAVGQAVQSCYFGSSYSERIIAVENLCIFIEYRHS